MQEEDKSFVGLTLSILLHIGLILLLIYMPKPQESARPESTEITILEPGKRQSMVNDTSIPKKDLIEDLKKKAEYLSKVTRRVKEQTKAKNNGRTQNNLSDIPRPSLEEPSGMGAQQGTQRKGGSSGRKSQDIQSSLTGLQPKPHQIGAAPGAQEGFGKNLVIGSSSLAEYIPGIKEGGFTALNTDQFTYYTFFERINEQVRYRWVTLVRNYLSSLNESALNQLAKYQRVYQIEIVLSDQGQYLKGFIHHSSGEQALDMTSIDAFQTAAPFLNPPKGLVEEDGFIHLHYSFVVEFRPRTGLGSN